MNNEVNEEQPKEENSRHNPHYRTVRDVLVSNRGPDATGEPAILRFYSDASSRRGDTAPALFVSLVQGASSPDPNYHKKADPVYLMDLDPTTLANEIMKGQAELRARIEDHNQKKQEEEEARNRGFLGLPAFKLV